MQYLDRNGSAVSAIGIGCMRIVVTRLHADCRDKASCGLPWQGFMRIIWTACSFTGRIRAGARAVDVGLTRAEWYALYKATGNTLP